MLDPFHQVKEVCEDKLCHGLGAVGGDVRHDDATLAGGGEIDHIVAGGENTDAAERRKPADRFAPDRGLIGEDDGRARRALDDQPGLGPVVDPALSQDPQRGPVQIAGVQRVAIEDDDERHVSERAGSWRGYPRRNT